MTKKIAMVSVLTAATLFLLSNTMCFAESDWAKDHPRRAQVNSRLNHQNKRINQEVKEGDLTKAEGAQLHHEDHQIRREERLMASQNGGHITKQEQRTLNQQENAVSRQIGQ